MIDTEAFSCQELVELVTDYLEGALTPADLRRFEEHIALCDACTEYLRQIRETIRIVGAITPADLTPEAEAELLAVFRSWAT
jgi:predicted anti-sigma-YlaC factor YlaD